MTDSHHIDAARLQALRLIRDELYAAVRVHMGRVSDARARLASARAARDANSSQHDMCGRLDERDRLARLLRDNDQQITALDAALRDAHDAQERVAAEWTAAAGLAEACEAFAVRHGVPLPAPAPHLGPDLSPPAIGVVR